MRIFVPLLLVINLTYPLVVDIPVSKIQYGIEDLQGFDRIKLKDGIVSGPPGAPEIPGLVYTISLPSDQKIKSVRVKSAIWSAIPGDFYLYPIQKPSIIGEPIEFFPPDSSIYAHSMFYPQEPISGFHSGNLRGYSLGQVLIIPFRYNPVLKRLEVLKELSIEILTVYRPHKIKPLRETGLSRSIFENLVSSIIKDGALYQPEINIIENPQDLIPSELPSLLGPPVDLVIITTQPLLSAYEQFHRFKKLFGFNTVIKTMEWIRANYSGVDDAEKVRNFIREAVEEWGVGFVLLGNDVPDIPTRWVWVEYVMNPYPAHFTTDLYYSDLDGNWNFDGDDRFGEVADSIDLYPDVIVGRIPAHNSDEVTGYFEKVHSYIFEIPQPPNSLEPYYKKTLFVTSMFWSYNDSYYIARYQLSPILPSNFEKHYLNEEPRLKFLNALHEGYNLVTFLAHGDVNIIRARTNPREYVTNFTFDSLTNNIYPLLVVISCYTGPFQEDCLGEHWVMNPQGGGIGYIGPTSSSAAYNHVDYVCRLFYILFNQPVGSALAVSKIPLIPYSQYDNWHRVFQFSLNLLGDPTVKIWNCLPRNVDSVMLNKDTLNIGIDTIEISVFPQIDTFSVIFYKEKELFIKGVGNNGYLVIPLKCRSEGFVKYTILSDCIIPIIDSIYVQPSAPYTVFSNYRLVDTTGNSNGIPNPNETIDLYLALINNGLQPADSVDLRIATSDSFINIIVDTASYGTIQPAQIKENLTPFRLKVSPEIPDGYDINIFLQINCGTTIYDTCQIIVEAPILALFTQHYSNAGGLYKIVPFVENQGHCEAESVYAIISSLSDTITILDSIAHFDLIQPNSIVQSQDTLRLLKNYPGNVCYKFSLYYRGLKIQEKIIVLGIPQRIDSLWSFGNPNSINLNWILVPDAVGYRIYRSRSFPHDFKFIKNPLLPTARFEDYGVQSGVDYYYYITAVDSSMNEGVSSDTIKARVNPAVAPGWPRKVYGYLFSSPNFGDLDPSYPGLEITVASRNGDLYMWHYDGTPVGNDVDGRIFTCGSEIWSSPAIGDVDNDGVLEICFGIRRWWDNFYILKKYGTDWAPLTGWPKTLGSSVLGSPVLADIDGDEDLEIFIISEDGKLFAFHHDGSGLYSPDGLLKNLYGWHGGSLAIGDLDRDYDFEIVACGGSNSDSLFVWDRYGNYFEPFPICIGRKMSYSPVLGDVIGDGDLEICFYTDSTDIVHLVDAAGHILWQEHIPALGDVEAYPVIANITGNERPEIIVGNNQGSMYLSAFDSLGNMILGFRRA